MAWAPPSDFSPPEDLFPIALAVSNAEDADEVDDLLDMDIQWLNILAENRKFTRQVINLFSSGRPKHIAFGMFSYPIIDLVRGVEHRHRFGLFDTRVEINADNPVILHADGPYEIAQVEFYATVTVIQYDANHGADFEWKDSNGTIRTDLRVGDRLRVATSLMELSQYFDMGQNDDDNDDDQFYGRRVCFVASNFEEREYVAFLSPIQPEMFEPNDE